MNAMTPIVLGLMRVRVRSSGSGVNAIPSGSPREDPLARACATHASHTGSRGEPCVWSERWRAIAPGRSNSRSVGRVGGRNPTAITASITRLPPSTPGSGALPSASSRSSRIGPPLVDDRERRDQPAAPLAVPAEHERLADHRSRVGFQGEGAAAFDVGPVGDDERQAVPQQRPTGSDPNFQDPRRARPAVGDRAPDILDLESAPRADVDLDVHVVAAEQHHAGRGDRDVRTRGIARDQARCERADRELHVCARLARGDRDARRGHSFAFIPAPACAREWSCSCRSEACAASSACEWMNPPSGCSSSAWKCGAIGPGSCAMWVPAR